MKSIRSTHFLIAKRTAHAQRELDDVDVMWATCSTVVRLLVVLYTCQLRKFRTVYTAAEAGKKIHCLNSTFSVLPSGSHCMSLSHRRNSALANSLYNKMYMVHFSCNSTIKYLTFRIPGILLTKSGNQKWKQMRQMVFYNVTSLFIYIPVTEVVKTMKDSCDKTALWETSRN